MGVHAGPAVVRRAPNIRVSGLRLLFLGEWIYAAAYIANFVACGIVSRVNVDAVVKPVP